MVASKPTWPAIPCSIPPSSPLFFALIHFSISSQFYSGLAVYPSGACYCLMELAGVASLAGMDANKEAADGHCLLLAHL